MKSIQNVSKERILKIIDEYKMDGVQVEEVYEKLCNSDEFSKMCQYVSNYLSNVPVSNNHTDENYHAVVTQLIEPELVGCYYGCYEW